MPLVRPCPTANIAAPLLRESAPYGPGHGPHGSLADRFPRVGTRKYPRPTGAGEETGNRPQHRIAALSYDSAGRNALRAPWAIYPLHPVVCARLIGDISVFMVESCGPDLAQLMQAAGLNARWAPPAAHASVMQPGEVVMEFTETVRTPIGSGLLELKRTLQMRQSDLDRYLIELLDPTTWTVAVRSMFEDPRLAGQPWPYYRDKDHVWV